MKSLKEYIKESQVNESLTTLLGAYFVFVGLILSELTLTKMNPLGEEDLVFGEGYSWTKWIKRYGIIYGTILWMIDIIGDEIGSVSRKRYWTKYNYIKEELLKDPEVQQFIRNPKKFKRLKDLQPIFDRYELKDRDMASELWKDLASINPNAESDKKDIDKTNVE